MDEIHRNAFTPIHSCGVYTYFLEENQEGTL
jgi:hypothetical protein